VVKIKQQKKENAGRTLILDWQLTKKQKIFIDSTCDEVLLGGAAGGGKSHALLIDALIFALKYPASRQLILRRTFPELRRSLILVSFSLYPLELASYFSVEHCWRFANGSRIEFGHCENEYDVSKYQSAEYDCIRFDELTHFTQYQYICLMSRLRGINNYPKQIKSATNPGGIGHHWVKDRFISQGTWGEPFQIHGQSRVFIPAKIYDNCFLMNSDPDYIKRLEQLPQWEKKALLEGDWDLFVGQFFPEYRIDVHGIKPFSIPRQWRRFVSLDWGYNDPCAVLWHAICDGHVYTYRELYVREMTANQVAKEIIELSKDEEIAYIAASPDMWQKRGVDSLYGENIADSFTALGLPLVKADNARLVGWQRVREYMAPSPDGKPWWQFFPDLCPNLARTLPAIIYDTKNPEDAADGEDHAAESLRYALMSRPRPAVKPLVQTAQPKSLASFFSGYQTSPDSVIIW